jgi:uncharacterized membrane protein YphA (DoxX/SURF4 family)
MMYLFLLGRILLGGYFIKSGYGHMKNLKMLAGYAGSKKVPMPTVSVFLSGLLLLIGGAGILLGIYVQFAIACAAIFLVVVTFKMHDFWKADPAHKMGEEINFYKNLALLGAVLMLLAIPLPWVLSLF